MPVVLSIVNQTHSTVGHLIVTLYTNEKGYMATSHIRGREHWEEDSGVIYIATISFFLKHSLPGFQK